MVCYTYIGGNDACISNDTFEKFMDSFESKKLALIRIWQILEYYSDEQHPLTQEDIAQHLDADYGCVIERKAISRNISLLKEAGLDIVSGRRGSYLSSRRFENSELRLMIDGILSSRHITAGQSGNLINRICSLTSKYFKANVKHIYSVDDWSKTNNPELFYNMELIDEAIESKKQIHYTYNKFGIDKKLHKSSQQYVSPYQMILHNQRYYLMAWSEYWSNMVFHRLDHITDMTIVEEPAMKLASIEGYKGGIDYTRFASAMPYMYNDEPAHVKFRARVGILDQVVDWFGQNASIHKDIENDSFVIVTVKASPKAMEYWALQYLKYVEILSPDSLREQIKEDLRSAMEKYL